MEGKTIKYKAVYNTTQIQEVEILSETGSFVSIKGWNNNPQREAKQSNYCTYHDTHAAAKADILARLEETRRTRQSQLKWVELEIEKAKAL
jgi:hypothetical protein